MAIKAKIIVLAKCAVVSHDVTKHRGVVGHWNGGRIGRCGIWGSRNRYGAKRRWDRGGGTATTSLDKIAGSSKVGPACLLNVLP